MPERFIQLAFTDDAGEESPPDTRRRLKENFPPGSRRRMTQLGMLVGAVLGKIGLECEDALVYASGYGESRTLESYLDGFPHPSPTMFQTSIHPSGAQQGLIGRQISVREFFPLTGGACLTAHAILTAMLCDRPRTCLCGGEETATWLLENQAASERSFALALLLSAEPPAKPPLGTLKLSPDDSPGELAWPEFFDLVHRRKSFEGAIGAGMRLRIAWS